MDLSDKTKIVLSALIFGVTSILGGILAFERYPSLWPAFPHFTIWWKVYLDHFMAGFLIPVWGFIIYNGIILLFNKEINLDTQKRNLFLGFMVATIIALIWDLAIPIFYLSQYIVAHSYSLLILIQSLKLWYLSPRWEFIQFLFDMGGILCAITFFKFLRKDLE